MRLVLGFSACAVLLLTACSQAEDTGTATVQATSTQGDAPKAERFDLNCNGSVDLDTASNLDEPTPFTTHLRIDLTSMAWCRESCDRVLKIAGQDWQTISLLSNVSETPYGRIVDNWTVNRLSGEYREVTASSVTTLKSAQCEKLPFSGFPEAKF